MRTTTNFLALAGAALTLLTGCTVKDVDTPGLTGPSTFAHSIVMIADRDALNQNGSDFTDIRITATGPTGQSENIRLNAQIFVDGIAQDYGTLSTKSPITPTTIRYTAPPASALSQLPQVISIRVTPFSSGDFRGEISREIDLRLVPQGVILPTNPNLVPQFAITPTAPQVFQLVSFDASTTTNNGASCGTACSYSWNFGDGTSATGITTTHVFRTVTAAQVVLTVTDARGAQASTLRSITPAAATQPTGVFRLSPSTNLATNVDIFFNASEVRWAGRNIVSYDWNFGDGSRGTGVTTTHRYSGAGSFTVTLTLTDDLGAQGQITQTIDVTSLGGATANLRASTSSPRVNQRVVFDATGSIPSAGASIVSYKFIYGDGGEETSDAAIQSHTYSSAGPFTATVVITDSNGKTASGSVTLTVAP